MSAWTSIKFRCVDIIENDTGLNPGDDSVNTYPYRYLPDDIDNGIMPCVILAAQGEDNFEWDGFDRHIVNYRLQMRLYIQPAFSQLESVGEFSVEAYFDLFKDAFLSRPQMQYNDTGLTDGGGAVSGNIILRVTSALTKPLEYPIGSRRKLYYGLNCELIIPWRERIPVKVRGV